MKDDICKRDEFSDGDVDDVSLSQALVMARRPRPVDRDAELSIEVGQCLTNVPHLVVHHSPDGFEFGYAGSGPADLALNVCQVYLNGIGYKGERTECYDGNCWSLAWVLHQEFKSAFIANAPRTGTSIPWEVIERWFEEHINADMKSMYAMTAEVEGD